LKSAFFTATMLLTQVLSSAAPTIQPYRLHCFSNNTSGGGSGGDRGLPYCDYTSLYVYFLT
jgi:hypothetical protein